MWLLPLLPLAGFAVNVALGQRLRLLAGWLATALVAASFVIAVAAFFALLSHGGEERTQILRGYQWFTAGDLRVAFDFRWDQLSATMALVVTGVSGLIHLYSIGYMAHDDRSETFFAWLNLFVAAMLVLVLAQNFLVMFLGWEGVGLCSYLLIGYWFNRRLPVVQPDARVVEGVPDQTEEVWAPPAAKKAFLANRVGDLGFLIAMFLLFQRFGSLDFDDVLGQAGGLTGATATAVALLLFLACAGKSAQIPLYVWLPDAMAGPTPVSALIHAATMVTAGVFLVTHAFFKAQLFLGAGSVMHGNDDDTDVKHFGGLRAAMPITFWTMGAAWLAIIGFPLTSGFFSKEAILAAAFHHGGIGVFGWAVGALTAGLTAFYMSRLFFLTFLGAPRWPDGRHPHESPPVMTVPLVVLAVLALVAGLFLGGFSGAGPIGRFLEPALGGAPEEGESFLAAFLLTLAAVGVAAVGAFAAWWVYLSGRVEWLGLRVRFAPAWRLLAHKLYVDEVYEFFTVTLGRAAAAFLAVNVDQRTIDGAVNGVAAVVGAAASRGRRLQTGLVRTYAVGVLGGAVLIVAFLVFRP